MNLRRAGRSDGPRLAFAFLLIAGSMMVGATLPAGAGQPGPQHPAGAGSKAAQGLVYDGLQPKDRGPCRHAYRVRVPGAGTPICTHGPDPAPAGVDVTQAVSVSDLTSRTTDATEAAATVQCIDDGVSGSRVQAIYAVASGVPDRYSSIAPLISGWAGQMDSALNQSAAETGGERHLRFVTNPDCSLSIAHVVLSPTGDDAFNNTVTELRNLGYGQSGRKYLVWMDATVYCGIAQLTDDDSAGATNNSNTWTMYGRVDSGCWGRSDHLSELHELAHTLGAVQITAPHATPGYHCAEEYDAMCYADSSGVTMTYLCPSDHEWLLDCNHDDYFSTAPLAGSYLATHWNVANSVFLSGSATGPSPPPSPSPSPTVTVTATKTFTGSVSSKSSKKTFSLTVGAGDAINTLQFSGTGKTKSTTLRMRILAADGTVMADTKGPSAVQLTKALTWGTYIWEVSGTSSASFSLQITYAAP